VFNVHASLLERSGKTRWLIITTITNINAKGNGSITGIPIIETINCDFTEYIATNVISITDGQIYTNGNLFKNGLKPAVDSALSVSRVGSNAQFKYLKRLVGSIKNDLTNYRTHLETCQIADEEEETEEIRLLRLKGRALESMYYQDWLDLSPIEETVLLLLLYNKGYFNGDPLIEQFNNQLLPYIRTIVGLDFLYLR
jgi:F-type H+-transporting ATPase subunit alpha